MHARFVIMSARDRKRMARQIRKLRRQGKNNQAIRDVMFLVFGRPAKYSRDEIAAAHRELLADTMAVFMAS